MSGRALTTIMSAAPALDAVNVGQISLRASVKRRASNLLAPVPDGLIFVSIRMLRRVRVRQLFLGLRAQLPLQTLVAGPDVLLYRTLA